MLIFLPKRALFLGGEWSLVTPLVFKTSEPVNPAGGFDSHPPPPIKHLRDFFQVSVATAFTVATCGRAIQRSWNAPMLGGSFTSNIVVQLITIKR